MAGAPAGGGFGAEVPLELERSGSCGDDHGRGAIKGGRRQEAHGVEVDERAAERGRDAVLGAGEGKAAVWGSPAV